MRHLKLWTFTLPKVFPICVARLMWQSLRESLQRNLDFSGVRTFELHPRGHGLHVHVITDRWYSVHQIRHFAKLNGWGRIDAIPVVPGSRHYPGKDLNRKRHPALAGVRLWDTIGDIDKSYVRDIQTKSQQADAYKKILAQLKDNVWLNLSMPYCPRSRQRMKFEVLRKLAWDLDFAQLCGHSTDVLIETRLQSRSRAAPLRGTASSTAPEAFDWLPLALLAYSGPISEAANVS